MTTKAKEVGGRATIEKKEEGGDGEEAEADASYHFKITEEEEEETITRK